MRRYVGQSIVGIDPPTVRPLRQTIRSYNTDRELPVIHMDPERHKLNSRFVMSDAEECYLGKSKSTYRRKPVEYVALTCLKKIQFGKYWDARARSKGRPDRLDISALELIHHVRNRKSRGIVNIIITSPCPIKSVFINQLTLIPDRCVSSGVPTDLFGIGGNPYRVPAFEGDYCCPKTIWGDAYDTDQQDYQPHGGDTVPWTQFSFQQASCHAKSLTPANQLG